MMHFLYCSLDDFGIVLREEDHLPVRLTESSLRAWQRPAVEATPSRPKRQPSSYG